MASKARNLKNAQVKVSTGISTTEITITDITNTVNPVVTATGHGLKDTDAVVAISDVTGMTDLNGYQYPFVIIDDDTLRLMGLDTTDMPIFGGAGKASPLTWQQGCEITGFSGLDGSTDEMDITTICSIAKENEPGLRDYGNFSFEAHYVWDDKFRQEMIKINETQETRWFYIYQPPEPARPKKDQGGMILWEGFVTNTPVSWNVGSVPSGSINIRVTGRAYINNNVKGI